MSRPFASRADRRRNGRRPRRGDHRAAVERPVVIGPTPRLRIGRRVDQPPVGEESERSRHSAAEPGRRRHWAWLAAGAVLGLLLGVVVATFVHTGPDGDVQLGPAGLAVAPPAAPSAAGSRGTFGQRVTTSDGIAIEVAEPVPYEPSERAAGHDRARAVLVTTTVVNGSDAPFELNTFAFGPTATHRDRAAARIFDVAGSLVAAVPVMTVAPGATLTYRTAFSLDRASGVLALRYGPGAVFTGEV